MPGGLPKAPPSNRDQPTLVATSPAQRAFTSWTTAILLNIVVLGLFAEYADGIVIDSFTIVIFAAIVLRALLAVTLVLEHRVRNFFAGRGGTAYRVLGILIAIGILFSSKFVILEVIDIIFRDHVEIRGFVPLVPLIITMIVTERIVQAIYDRLATQEVAGP